MGATVRWSEGPDMLMRAISYLRENAELREAVGARADDALEPHELGAGEHNRNFWFAVPSTGRRFVLRVNVCPQPFHDNQVAYEFGALRFLEGSGCTPEAVYLDDSADAPGKGALVIGYREGDELDFDNLRPGDLRCAAQLMADVHAVPVGEGCPAHRPADPLRELFDECAARFELYRASASEDPRVTKWAERFISAARPLLEVPCNPDDCSHLINTETLPSHFLIPAHSAAQAAAAPGRGGRFTGHPGAFIDWERPIVGEVAQDVAYFVSPTTTFWDSDYLFPADGIDAFVEDYWRAVDGRFARGSFDERFHAYLVMTALRSVTWCCRALATGHNRAETAEKLPVYLSDDFMQMLADRYLGS